VIDDGAGDGDELRPATDEYGRTDPDVLERERRRAERERRRAAQAELGKKVGKRAAKPKPKPARAEATPKPAPKPAPRPAPKPRPKPMTTPARAEPEAAAPAAKPPAAGPPPKRPTRSGGRGRAPFAFRRRRFLALGAALVGLLLVWFLVALFQPFAGKGEGTGAVSVSIPQGADAGKIADILDQNGVISSGQLFQIRLKLSGKSNDIQAGDYTLAHGMSYGTAIDRLTGQAGGQKTLLIPEGYSRPQIAEKLTSAGIGGDYLAASVSSPGFNPATYGAKSAASLEGFLFPATYDLPQGATATDVVAQQLAAFKRNIKGVDMTYARKKNLSVYDVLTIASMVEREVSSPKERPLVAAVIYNRLSRGQPLGIDATTRFETGNFDQPLTNAQLQADTPYNTRTNAGLPPGPIGNPGIDSIKAAAHPAKVPYLFYVVNPGTCEHTFVNTEAEFQAAVAKYNAARDAAGGNSPTNC
jgi:uncharacterized YceG family protein